MPDKQIAAIFSLFFSVIAMSGCNKGWLPPDMTGTPTCTQTAASPTITCTASISPTNTPYQSPTVTRTPQPTATPAAGDYVIKALMDSYAMCDVAVTIQNLIPVVNATVTVDDIDDTVTAYYLPFFSYDNYFELPSVTGTYHPGHTVRVSVSVNGYVFTADMVMPGGITVAPDGLTVSFISPGDDQNSGISVMDQTSTIIYNAPDGVKITSPVSIPPGIYTAGQAYTVAVHQEMKKNNAQGMFAGANASSYLRCYDQSITGIVK